MTTQTAKQQLSFQRSFMARKVVIIGVGPAGLEAAAKLEALIAALPDDLFINTKETTNA